RPRQIFVPYNGKIADITETDTNKHTLDLETALTETRKIIALSITAKRMGGTGEFNCYPNEGAQPSLVGSSASVYLRGMLIIKDGTQRLEYNLTVANDDWDLYCLGYVVEA
ncbi:unnamed protein product, partial [marine sediment metagenome]